MRIRQMTLSLAGALAISAFAPSAQTLPQPGTSTDQKAAPAAALTFAGCVQKESTVLKRNPALGNVGMDDEFVLTSASSGSESTGAPKPDVEPAPAPIGTSGAAGFGVVYRLTGDKERELKPYVGQRVEITGTLKDKETAKDKVSAMGANSKTELTPENTAELTIVSIKPVSGTCAPAIK